jgi:hypothetical protein
VTPVEQGAIAMRAKLILLVAAILIGGQAGADFKTVARAYEVPLSELSLPISSSGMVSFRQCDSCERLSVRVSPGTRFLVNDQSLSLDEFRNAVRYASNAANRAVTVLRDLDSDTILEIRTTL